MAQIEWSPGAARVTHLQVGADDDTLFAHLRSGTKVGIDVPLGWPETFVEFLVAQRDGGVVGPRDLAGVDWRRTLANRRTDLAVRKATRLVPLSVATDRIAMPAIRAAGLLSRLAEAGCPVDRAGAGAVVEVYPAASLHVWGLRSRGYKGKANARALSELLDDVVAAAPWLELGEHSALARRSDHAFDAVIAALAARAAMLGLTSLPQEEDQAAAAYEGWIALPLHPLAALAPK